MVDVRRHRFNRSLCRSFSTWIATPNLTLEGNPLARRLGWRWGIPVNFVAALLTGCQPTLAIAVGTTSALVAARNLQSAWVMRTMGEGHYRFWISDRISEAPRGLAAACFLGEALLTGLGISSARLCQQSTDSYGRGSRHGRLFECCRVLHLSRTLPALAQPRFRLNLSARSVTAFILSPRLNLHPPTSSPNSTFQ